ncbi:unnamed protein product [Darwinula stevensoni]|uniref:beta-N-acetylhexosaminidase n=1 Tax=Darwinula stevensoni TaxID=69355 RepID=A0A7R9FNB8_9CRUS|nr:unnamed protein product [Darwinula stevensoni]CAG0896593.1 unnamed protein product [Darwinula stevensoni]
MNGDRRNFMTRQKISSFQGLQAYYMNRLVKLLHGVSSKKKNCLVWQNVFDNGVRLGPDAVVHVWKGDWETELATVRVKVCRVSADLLQRIGCGPRGRRKTRTSSLPG